MAGAAVGPTGIDALGLTADALLALAARVDEVSVDLARAAATVREGWQGPHRARFDTERARRDALASSLLADCRRLAAR